MHLLLPCCEEVQQQQQQQLQQKQVQPLHSLQVLVLPLLEQQQQQQQQQRRRRRRRRTALTAELPDLLLSLQGALQLTLAQQQLPHLLHCLSHLVLLQLHLPTREHWLSLLPQPWSTKR
jgi:hypothetical protein